VFISGVELGGILAAQFASYEFLLT